VTRFVGVVVIHSDKGEHSAPCQTTYSPRFFAMSEVVRVGGVIGGGLCANLSVPDDANACGSKEIETSIGTQLIADLCEEHPVI
jgi:hypothetical protein